jgi:cobalt-zinc-cadmium efflux system outer membrane protein
MKQKTLVHCLVFAGVLLVSLAAPKPFAQAVPATNRVPAVTLAGLVAEAMEKNPELNFYRAEISAAKGDRRTAGTLANPQAEVELGRKRTTDGGGGLAGEGLAWSVSVSQSFEYPGRLALRKAIANRQVELAELGFAQFKAALAAKVRSLGYALLIAQEKAQAAQEVSARGRELVEVLVQREPAGVMPLLETRIIEANIITLQRRASGADKAAQAALFELNQLRGQALSTPLTVVNTTLKFPSLGSVEELLNLAATNNFELQMRQVELTQQGFKVDLTKNERWPAISIAPFYSQEKAGDTEQRVGVGVSVPLPLWNRNKGNIEAAQARQGQAATSLLLSQRQVERELRERYLLYQSRLVEMSQWPNNAAQELREAAELGDRHYRLGALPISTYTELQGKYLDALEAILDTQGDALESLQQLELLTGRPLLELRSANQEQPRQPEAPRSPEKQK